jgi:hypothetical protein
MTGGSVDVLVACTLLRQEFLVMVVVDDWRINLLQRWGC